MSLKLNWKVGFEIELMAPLGSSRLDLAEHTAHRIDGQTICVFHSDSEPAMAPGTPVFENLTPGFRVEDTKGAWVASFVDDLTLQSDFNRTAKPKDGWYRIVSDDKRFLDLIERHCNAADPLETVLNPLAELFGTKVDLHDSAMVRVSDKRGGSIAVGATLPGERERPCEIVTAPLKKDHHKALAAILDDAKKLGFSLPRESATHIHFDAKPLRSATFIMNFVNIISLYGNDFRALVEANSECVRIGQWTPELSNMVSQDDFIGLSWEDTRVKLASLELTKYCDFNLVNLINQDTAKDTLEIRILPGMLDAQQIMRCAMLFESVIRYCCDPSTVQPKSFVALIKALSLQLDLSNYWLTRAKNL